MAIIVVLGMKICFVLAHFMPLLPPTPTQYGSIGVFSSNCTHIYEIGQYYIILNWHPHVDGRKTEWG